MKFACFSPEVFYPECCFNNQVRREIPLAVRRLRKPVVKAEIYLSLFAFADVFYFICSMEKKYEIHFAPLQGYTDWIYRNIFARFFEGVDVYYTPFVRVEKGTTFRNRDLRDIDPANNTVACLIPQILPASPEEFRLLAALLQAKGYTRVDINLGCPFPLIAGQKKGAGMLPYPDLVGAVLAAAAEFPAIRFSVKMRLGWSDKQECLNLLPVLNECPLTHITLHARTGKQQYKGETDPELFEHFYRECRHSLFYNGDLNSAQQIQMILHRFPELKGVVLGRGLLSNPALAENLRYDRSEPADSFSRKKDFMEALFRAYRDYLKDERVLLQKMKSYWEYFLPDADRKLKKKLQKAKKIADYQEIVNLILKRN